MTELYALAFAAFSAGLLGSVHCVAMCGGLASAFSLHAGARSTRRRADLVLAFNAGRLLSYAGVGALAGYFGLALSDSLPQAVGILRFAALLVVVGMGLRLALGSRWPYRLGLPINSVWSIVSPLAARLLPILDWPRALGLGMLWGLLPCGMLYSVVLLAASSARPLDAALVLIAFGAGTTPALVLGGLSLLRLSEWLRARRLQAVGGGILIALGVLGMSFSLLPASSHEHHSSSHHAHSQLDAKH